MSKFMIAYHGGSQPTSKEEGAAQMERWSLWIKGLGDAVINRGTPLMNPKLVTSSNIQDDNDPNSMKGFAVIKADSIEAAIEIAKSDPFLETGGAVRLSQMMEMGG